MSFWPSAYQAFRSTLSNEGYTDYPYLDVKGFVTVGQGNKIDNSDVEGDNDPAAPALELSWYDAFTNQTLTDDQVRAQWKLVKDRQDMKGDAAGQFKTVTTMRLTDASITKYVQEKMDSMIATLGRRLPAIASWPADAQLAMLRWAWAFGPNAKFPLMFAALGRVMPDFDEACNQAELDQLNLPVKNDITHMFQNATDVLDQGLDHSVLYWPNFPPGSNGTRGSPLFSVASATLAGAGLGFLAWQGFKMFIEGQPRKTS